MTAPAIGRKLPRGKLYFEPAVAALEVARHCLARDPAEPDVARLEGDVAALTGAAEVVALPHCRTALWLALRALQLPPGSGVAMTAVTVPPVLQAVLLAGLRPDFVDLGVQTGQLDLDDLARRLRPDTRALLVTHLFGWSADMDAVTAFAQGHGLVVIEDVSQALGARWRGRTLGSWGRVGVASISTMKPVSSFHGGLLLTDDRALAGEVRRAAAALPALPRARLCGWLGRDLVMDAATRPWLFEHLTWPLLTWAERYAPASVAEFQRGNVLGLPRDRRWRALAAPPEPWLWRLGDARARLARRLLRPLVAGNERRRALGARLRAALQAAGAPGGARVPADAAPVDWRFPYWTNDPAGLRSRLRGWGVDSAVTNLAACHRLVGGGAAPALPQAEAAVERCVLLPMHDDMSEADVDRVAAAVVACEGAAASRASSATR